MKKRLLSILIALSMVFTILPISAMAVEVYATIDANEEEVIASPPLEKTDKSVVRDTSVKDLYLPEPLAATVRTANIAEEDSGSGGDLAATNLYGLWVRGVQVTDANKDDVLCDGGTVKYNSITNTLTLTNADITYSGGNTIYTITDDLIVEFYGTNIVRSTSSGDDCAFNTIGYGNITFRGTGLLTASGNYGGIYGFDDITIESGTINATGNIVGISSNRGVMTIFGGNVTATAKKSGGYGIGIDHNRTLELTVSGNATLTSIGKNGAKVASKITTTNTTHNMIAGDNETNAVAVSASDSSAWEKTYAKLTPGNTISGTITSSGSGLMGANVQIQKDSVDFGVPAITEADGTYTTQTVPNGDYTIKISKFGYNEADIAAFNVSGSPVTGKDQILTIAPLSGTVTINGMLKYGQTLTASYDSGNNIGTLSYQWKRGETGDVIGTDSNTYTVVEADINQTLTCVVTSDVHPGTVSGSSLAIIGKADGSAVTGVSAVGCTTADNNDGMLIGLTTAMEYKKSGDASYTTVSGSALTGLTNGDYLVRVAETDTHNAGEDSTFTVASFIPAPTYTINGTITDSDTNSGIAGAAVQLKNGSSNIGSLVFTDSRGAYTIYDVPAGIYTIEVSAAGYDKGIISSVDVLDADVNDRNLMLTKTVIFNPITDITMNNSTSIQAGTNLTLMGTIIPYNATNQTITWSVENANGTGAIITGNTFRAASAGIATVKATVVNGLSTYGDYTKIFTIRITAPYTPVLIPDFTSSSTQQSEGTVEKDIQQEKGTSTVNVNSTGDELRDRVLTPEEQELLARGVNAKIILKVRDINTTVSDKEKKLIQEKLVSENVVSHNVAANIPFLYVDLSLYKQVGSQEQRKITKTNGKISISIEVPKQFWNTDETKSREFYILRIHEQEVTRIQGSYDADKHLFTFETDRFSTYALTYQDTSRIQTYHDFNHLQLMAKADNTTQTLSYKKITNVDGYLIYGGKCGEEMKELAKVPAKTTSYTVKNLKKGTYYKYQVKAYQVINKEQVIIMTSKVIHSTTKSKTYANPTKVTMNAATVTLTAGKSKTITGQVVLPKGKKQKNHTAVIRYESSNKAIATVNSKGKITAKAKGTSYVYAYAQNGVFQKIKVVVK